MRALAKRRSSWIAISSVSLLAAGCSNSSAPQSNLSTASILGEAPAAASGERPGIRRDDPMARPVQVAWTSARAQKCGFNFDPVKLRANYLASEQSGGADANRLATVTKSYDMTVDKIKSTIGGADAYCTERTSAAIKADLTRHLAGNYDPNFPEDKKTAGGLFGAWGDDTTQEPFDTKNLWRDLQNKKDGVRSGN